MKRGYVAKSERGLALQLTDYQYDAVSRTIDQWRTRHQPSYNLNRSNCVHFLGAVAHAVSLETLSVTEP